MSTQSLCPVCLRVLEARHEHRDGAVFLCRTCPEHGPFADVIWRGLPAFDSWSRPKTAKAAPNRQTEAVHGCPRDCGICPNHEQHSCTVLLEITAACNLNCPVCFADSGGKASFTPLEELIRHMNWIHGQVGDVVLQISGGEPTLYPELPALVREAKRLFTSVQLNTNGLLRAAEDPSLTAALAEAGLSWVFLQFDGVTDATYTALRGRPLLREKLAALDAFTAAGLPVILVPTLAAGVNDRELGGILRLALERAPGVRGLHVQPMTFSGRNRLAATARITLPEVLAALCEQSDGRILPEHATPPGCEHERCSFHCRYRLTPEGEMVPLRGESCCTPIAASEGVTRAVETIRRSWGGAGGEAAGDPSAPKDAFDAFIRKARSQTFSVTCMAFQDARTVELERLRGCCVLVFRPPHRLVPFCACNLTAEVGRALHRTTE